MKSLFVRLLGNPVVFAAAFLSYVGFIGPWLISAPSTIAVLFGLFIAALIVWWVWKMPELFRARSTLINRNTNQEK